MAVHTLSQSSVSFLHEGAPSKKVGCTWSHFRQKWQYTVVKWLSLEGMVADSVSIYSCVNCVYLACESGHAPNLGSRKFRNPKFTRPTPIFRFAFWLIWWYPLIVHEWRSGMRESFVCEIRHQREVEKFGASKSFRTFHQRGISWRPFCTRISHLMRVCDPPARSFAFSCRCISLANSLLSEFTLQNHDLSMIKLFDSHS